VRDTIKKIGQGIIVGLVTATMAGVCAAQEPPADSKPASDSKLPADSSPGQVILIDNRGRVVIQPASSLHPDLLPPADIGLERQIPSPISGAKQPAEVTQRIEASRPAGFQVFPAVQPHLASYLASQDENGNTAARPGALLPLFPLEPLVQGEKYRLSGDGLRYSLQQTFTYAGLTNEMKGGSELGYYTFDLVTKWAVFDAPSSGSAGWISAQIEAKTGLGADGQTQDARTNLGSVTDPTGIWSSHNGFRLPELAWQQSLRHGEVVLLAGMVFQGNYLDGNSYANTGRGQFVNSALIDTMVMPLPNYNFGVNLQWQPSEEWYGMFGASAGNGHAGVAPWTGFNWDNWSLISEFGYAPDDFLGLGPGIYRIQPFLARAGGPVQGGVGFNFQQQLGQHSPFGWFGRFGVGGSQVSAGASTQIGTGFVLHAPLENAGVVKRLSNDLLGVGFVWSQPSATTQTVYHRNEYVFETFYTLQLSPTTRLQPDMQLVWNPAFNPDPGPATVFQIQAIIAW
jgi:porin